MQDWCRPGTSSAPESVFSLMGHIISRSRNRLKPENAEAGYQLGLRPLLLEHGHNMHYYHADIALVKNWREIYQVITGQSA